MSSFRVIPDEAFGAKPVVRLRDIDAVVHNYRLFKEKANATNTICGAVVKAEVHGLQMKDAAPALYAAGVRYFFVEELCEGMKLRGILGQGDAKIFAMAGLLHGEERYFAEYNIIPCVNCLEQLKRWNAYNSVHRSAPVVIHLDTHMHRLGLLDDEVEILSRDFSALTHNLKVVFYMSHFYDIKGSDHTNCNRQYDVLKRYLSILPVYPVSFACTDSVVLLENTMFNMDIIRPGIGLVGGAPNAQSPVSPDARHTMEIYAKLSQIKTVKKGETIGYGGAYTTKRDMKLALVHIGYKDGYLRLLSETDEYPKGVYMVIDKYRVPIIGKISLGITTVDVTDVPDSVLEKYKYAEVIGPNVDIKFLADKVGCYEILAALGRPNEKFADYTLQEYTEGIIKAALVKEARTGINLVGYCGHHCEFCFLSQWCGGCRSNYNCCSYAALFPDGCPNVKCAKDNKLSGCYDCHELADCKKGYYEKDGEYIAKATALFIKKYGEACYTATLEKAIESGENYPKSFDQSGSVEKARSTLEKYL